MEAVAGEKVVLGIVSFASTLEYSRSIPHLVGPQDRVLEVGCAEGDTSYILLNFSKEVTGIDISTDCIERAQNKFKGISFHCTDVFKSFDIVQSRFDVVYIDVSGRVSLSVLLPVVDYVEQHYSPRFVVVKSYQLNEYLRVLTTGGTLASKLSSQVDERRRSTLNAQLTKGASLVRDLVSTRKIEQTRTGKGAFKLKELAFGVKRFMDENNVAHKIYQKLPYPFCNRVPSSPKERANLSGINPTLLLKILICFVSDHPSPVLLICSGGVQCDISRFLVFKDGKGDILFDSDNQELEKVSLELANAKKVKDWNLEFGRVYLKGYCPPFGPHWNTTTKIIMDQNLQNQRIAFFELDYATYVQISIEELTRTISPNKILPFT